MFSIDHIGIAVKSLAAAKNIYEKLGLSVSPEETVSDDSTIAKFIAKRGEGLHHVCMRVPDLAAAVAELKQEGVRFVSDEIKIGAGGHRYVFVHPQSAGGMLLELVDSAH
jgi:catechol 2,3-dioxygenase-like lactoylglutathione lyase family enzyme